jgi:subtilisin family serine protease
MLSKRFTSLYGVPHILCLRFKLGILFVVSVLLSLNVLSPVQAEPQLFPPDLFTLVESQGSVRLIIGLEISSSQRSGQRTRSQRSGELASQFEDNKINESYGNVSSNSETYLTIIDYQRRQITQAQEEFLSSLGITEERLFFSIPYLVVSADSSTLEAIYNSSLVTSIALDRISPPALSDSIPLTNTNAVWDKGYSGVGQTVAILDTGVDKTHPDLAGQIISEACYSTTYSDYNATSLCPIPDGNGNQVGEGAGVNCDSNVSGCGHGTHVAGIVAANGAVKGVAKDANIIAIQVFSRFNGPTYCGFNNPCALSFTSDQIAGLEHVLTLHESGMTIAAANMSLGGGGI